MRVRSEGPCWITEEECRASAPRGAGQEKLPGNGQGRVFIPFPSRWWGGVELHGVPVLGCTEGCVLSANPHSGSAPQPGSETHSHITCLEPGMESECPGDSCPIGNSSVPPGMDNCPVWAVSQCLSHRRQSGGGTVTETAVNLCGQPSARQRLPGAQRVPRRIRPGEEMLQGEMKGSLQWNSCGISFPREIFPANPP